LSCYREAVALVIDDLSPVRAVALDHGLIEAALTRLR
jgi:hypothetical protein